MCFFPSRVCVFFFPPLSSFFSGKWWEEGFRQGRVVVTVATVSNRTVIIHRGKYTRPRRRLLCRKTNISPPPEPLIYLPLLFWAGRAGEGRRSQLTLWPPGGRPVSQPGGLRPQGQENKVEDAAAPFQSPLFCSPAEQ